MSVTRAGAEEPLPTAVLERIIAYAADTDEAPRSRSDDAGLAALDADIALLTAAYNDDPARVRSLIAAAAEALREPVYIDVAAAAVQPRPEYLRSRAERLEALLRPPG